MLTHLTLGQFQFRCYESDVAAVQETICSILDAYDKEHQPPRVKRPNSSHSEDEFRCDLSSTTGIDVERYSHTFDLPSALEANAVFSEAVLAELRSVTGSSVMVDEGTHSLVIDRANEFNVKFDVQRLFTRLQGIIDDALRTPVHVFHVNTSRLPSDVQVRRFCLIDQPNNLLRRTLVTPELAHRLPITCTWAASRHGPLDTAYASVSSGELPEAEQNVWLYATQSIASLHATLVADQDVQEPQRIPSPGLTERITRWVPAPDQHFEALDWRSRCNDYPEGKAPTVSLPDQELSVDDDYDHAGADDALLSLDNLLSDVKDMTTPHVDYRIASCGYGIDPVVPSTGTETAACKSPDYFLHAQRDIIEERLAPEGMDGLRRLLTMRQQAGKGKGKSKGKNKTKTRQVTAETVIPAAVCQPKTMPSPWRNPQPKPSQSLPQRKKPDHGNGHLAGTLSQCLETVKHYRGLVTAQVNIGKALFKRNLSSNGSGVISAQTLQDKLREGTLDSPIAFTQMITSAVDDTNRVLSLFRSPVPGSERMFGSKPLYAQSFFKLHFQDQAHIVELSSHSRQQVTTTILASCLLLYPDHVWDARFEVTGRKHTDMDDDLARIVRSIHMSPSANSLNWTYNGRGPVISRVLQKTALAIDTSYKGWALQMTEVQQYVLADTDKQCTARAGTRDDMIQQGRLWYEFSLLPDRDLFTENKTLGLGEAADCTQLSKEQIESMHQLTSGLIAQMNGVGMANCGPRGDAADLERIESAKQEYARARSEAELRMW